MLNEIQFIGNLTKKPELRTVKKKNGEDTLVTTITVAVDRKKAGLPIEGTDFFDVTAWGKTAENCTTYLDKGSRVLIKGYVVINSSEKDGQRRFFTQFTAQRVTFLSRSNQSSGDTNSQNNTVGTFNNSNSTNNNGSTFNNSDTQNNTGNFNNTNSTGFNPGNFVPIDSDDIPF